MSELYERILTLKWQEKTDQSIAVFANICYHLIRKYSPQPFAHDDYYTFRYKMFYTGQAGSEVVFTAGTNATELQGIWQNAAFSKTEDSNLC
jgi:hypothetical protein